MIKRHCAKRWTGVSPMNELRAMLGDRYDDVIIKATKRALLNYPNLPTVS